jgi:hypothetical protein
MVKFYSFVSAEKHRNQIGRYVNKTELTFHTQENYVVNKVQITA